MFTRDPKRLSPGPGLNSLGRLFAKRTPRPKAGDGPDAGADNLDPDDSGSGAEKWPHKTKRATPFRNRANQYKQNNKRARRRQEESRRISCPALTLSNPLSGQNFLRTDASTIARRRWDSSFKTAVSRFISSTKAGSLTPGRLIPTFRSPDTVAVSSSRAAVPASETALGLPFSTSSGRAPSRRTATRAVRMGTSVAIRFASEIARDRAAFSSSVSLGRRRAVTTVSYASASSRAR